MKNYYILIIAFTMTSCVSKKQFDLLLASKDALQKDYEALKDARRERQSYADSLVKVNNNLANASQESENWKNSYLSLYTTNEALNKEIATVRLQNQQFQNAVATNDDAHRKEIADRMKELDAREKDLRLIEAEMRSNQDSFDEMKNNLIDKTLKIRILSDSLIAKDFQIAELKVKINDKQKGGKK